MNCKYDYLINPLVVKVAKQRLVARTAKSLIGVWVGEVTKPFKSLVNETTDGKELVMWQKQDRFSFGDGNFVLVRFLLHFQYFSN